MNQTISVITPAYNEESNLSQFVARVTQVANELKQLGLVLEIVIVDDHSSDDTPRVARTLLTQYEAIKYVRLSRNSGSHAAISAGLKLCSGDCAVIMAADLQDPPETIPQLCRLWHEGNDVVWACRAKREGESARTVAVANTYYRVMKMLAVPDMPAQGADFMLISRRVIDAYNAIPEKHTNLFVMILWMGFRQTSIDYVKQARISGSSKWSLAKKIKLFIDSVVSFSYAPIRIMSAIGVLMATTGFVYACVVIVGRITGFVAAGTGFAAEMTVLLVGQGMIMLMLGILGEYVWRAYDEARGRPRYIVEEVETSNSISQKKETQP